MAAPPRMPPEPTAAPGAVEVFRSRGKKPCNERALVLNALGIQHGIVQVPGAFAIVVRAEDAERALDELGQYERENTAWPPRPEAAVRLTDGFAGGAVFVALMAVAYMFQHRAVNALDWAGVGASRAARIRDGEIWRCVTSLTLHADLPHVVANVVYGTFYGVLLSHVVGTGVGWLSVLAAGALGNLVNAWVQSPTHGSLGASTAVFGALGCLVACQWVRKYSTRQRWWPVLLGLTLLGWYGIPENALEKGIDFMAHITGFLAGTVVGFVDAWWLKRVGSSPAVQRAAAAAALGIVAGSWALALTLSR